MLGLYKLFQKEATTERPEMPKLTTPVNLYQQLRDLHQNEDKTLGKDRRPGYGWVDRKTGVVRIPIDHAIELVATKGVRFGKGPKSEIEMNSHAGKAADIPDAPPEIKNQKDTNTPIPPEATAPEKP